MKLKIVKPKKKGKNGGARPGAGRPRFPEGERKEPITIYARISDIEKFGGRKEVIAELGRYVVAFVPVE